MVILSSLHNDTLKELCLSQNKQINSEATNVIKTFVKCIKTLYRYLRNLSSNELCDNVAEIADGLVECYNLQCLDISNNMFTNEAVHKLLTSLLQMCKLRTLICENNTDVKVLKLAFKIIIEMKAQDRFEKTTNEDVMAFLSLLSSAVSVSSSNSPFVHHITKIRILTLQCSKHCKMSKNSAAFFEKFVELRILKLNGIYLEGDALDNIANVLAKNLANLEELHLNNCNLKTYGIKIITRRLSSCKKLYVLNLSYNKITDEAEQTLKNVAKQLYQFSLRKLIIHHNLLSPASMTKILSEIYTSSWLK